MNFWNRFSFDYRTTLKKRSHFIEKNTYKIVVHFDDSPSIFDAKMDFIFRLYDAMIFRFSMYLYRKNECKMMQNFSGDLLLLAAAAAAGWLAGWTSSGG